VKGVPFAAMAARQAVDCARSPPSGEQAYTRLTGSVGAPCAWAGAAAQIVVRSGAATVSAAMRYAVIRDIRNVSSAEAGTVCSRAVRKPGPARSPRDIGRERVQPGCIRPRLPDGEGGFPAGSRVSPVFT